MSRKRKSIAVEGGDSSRNSKGNIDSKKKSKKKGLDQVVVKTKIDKRPQPSGGGGGGDGDGDVPWSKSKKKRMRNLKSKLLKKQQDPSEPETGVVVNKQSVARHNSSQNKEVSTSTPTASDASTKQQQHAKQATDNNSSAEQTNDTAASVPSNHQNARGGPVKSALQQAFIARLSGSRFRILNEELYTTTSSSAYKRFSSNPELYDEYHDGFRSQVQHWPVNPVDVIVGRLKKDYVDILLFDNNNGEVNSNNDRNNKEHQIVVADFGCGDADLAKQLLKVQIPLQHQQHGGGKRPKGGGNTNTSSSSTSLWCPFLVHSFDLVSKSDLVTACDMSNVPLPNATVDVAVFCLSLMGTNLADFVREAHRVLKSNGRLKIAEVKSRFSSSSSSSSKDKNNNSNKHTSSKNIRNKKNSNKNNVDGQDEEREFIQILNQLGFECTRTDRSNKMFVLFELCKNGKMPDPKVEYTAKPCIYKRR